MKLKQEKRIKIKVLNYGDKYCYTWTDKKGKIYRDKTCPDTEFPNTINDCFVHTFYLIKFWIWSKLHA